MTFTEAVERLEAMECDNGQTWDLSENDQAAIRIVLNECAIRILASDPEYTARLLELRKAVPGAIQ